MEKEWSTLISSFVSGLLGAGVAIGTLLLKANQDAKYQRKLDAERKRQSKLEESLILITRFMSQPYELMFQANAAKHWIANNSPKHFTHDPEWQGFILRMAALSHEIETAVLTAAPEFSTDVMQFKDELEITIRTAFSNDLRANNLDTVAKQTQKLADRCKDLQEKLISKYRKGCGFDLLESGNAALTHSNPTNSKTTAL